MRNRFLSFLLILTPFLCLSCVTERLQEIAPGHYKVISNATPPLQIASAPAEGAPSQSIEEFVKDCRTEPDGRLTKFYRVNHQSGEALVSILNNWKSPEGKVVYYPQTKTVMITETSDTMRVLAEILAKVDSQSSQVLIKVRMVETRSGSNLEYGFEYNQDRTDRTSLINRLDVRLNPKNYNDSLKAGAIPFQGSTFTLATSGKHAGDIDIIIRALHESGGGKILSCPDLLVAENQSATLHTGQQVPFQDIQAQGTNILYFTKFKDVGAQLVVTPSFIGKESVTLRVQPQVSSLTGWTDPSLVGGISNPIISTRRCETTVTVRDEETLVIGGLLEDKKVLTKRSIPILGSIPVLGFLFSSIRYETETTLLHFILNVTIVSPEKPQGSPRIYEPESETK